MDGSTFSLYVCLSKQMYLNTSIKNLFRQNQTIIKKIDNEKTIIFFFVMLTVLAMGQQKTIRTAKYSPEIKLYDNKIIYENGGQYHYYYNEKDQEIYHGKMNGGGTKSFKNGSAKVTATYSEERNVKDGKLNGSIIKKGSITTSDMGVVISNIFQINGLYKEGVQQGVWEISQQMRGSMSGQTASEQQKWNYTYNEKGDIIGYKYIKNGKLCGNYSKNPSGTWNINDNIIVKNGIKVNSFIGYQGVEREPDKEQRVIIETLVKADGNYDTEDIFNKGYILEKKTKTCYGNDINAEAAPYDIVHLNNNEKVTDYFDYTYYVLKRIKFASKEDIKKSIDKSLYIFDPNESSLEEYLYNISRFKSNRENEIVEYAKDRTPYTYSLNYNTGIRYIKPSLTQFILDYLEERFSLVKKDAEDKQMAADRAKEEERIARENKWKNRQKERVNERLNKILVPWSRATSSWDKYLVGYRFKDIVEKYNTSFLDYELDIKDGGKSGYSTYMVSIEITNSSGEIIDFQRDLENAKKRNNIYDSIVTIEKDLLSKLDKDGMKDIKKVYKKGYLVKDIRAEKLSEYNHKLRQQEVIINYCYKFMTLRKEIAKNHNELNDKTGKCERYKDILGLYTAYYKTMDLGWNPSIEEAKGLATLSNIVKNQETYMFAMDEHKAIETTNNSILGQSSECKNVVKAYSTYFKIADKAWEKTETADELVATFSGIKEKQAGFMECLEKYNSVSSRNNAIVEKKKTCKTIVKIYKAYMKECEKIWAQTSDPAVLKKSLEKMLEQQETLLTAISGDNVPELDKKVKNAKCKDWDTMFSVIK